MTFDQLVKQTEYENERRNRVNRDHVADTIAAILESHIDYEDALDTADMLDVTGGAAFTAMGYQIAPDAIREAVRLAQTREA